MPSSPFVLCIIAIVALGALGLPIGHSMIVASILYLLHAGTRSRYRRRADPQRALQQLRSAGDTAVHSGRRFDEHRHPDRQAAAILSGAGRPLPRRPRPRQCRRQHDLRRHVRLGDRRRRRHRPHHHRHDDQGGKYPVAYAGAITASAAIIGPIIPPSIPMVVYALVSDTSIGYLFLGGFVPGVMLGHRIHGHERDHRPPPWLSGRAANSAAAKCRKSQ